MSLTPIPRGDKAREAIDALRGYVYQIYQSALAWIDLEPEEFLFLEVAEDYAVIAGDALKAVQVKETGHAVTINSDDIVASIDSFVDLRLKNPELQVRLRHLTTSTIGKEKSSSHRIGDTPTLETWRKLAKAGEVSSLKKILDASKLSEQTKIYIRKLEDTEFREEFLKRIHFDCGALDSKFLVRQLRSKLLTLLMERGGDNSQVDGCLSSIVLTLLHKATQKQKEERFVDRGMLEDILSSVTQISINRTQLEVQNALINKVLAASIPQETNLVAAHLAEPRSIDEVPLPTAIASRTVQMDNIASSLTLHGASWIFGAAGVGKTVGAKIAARRIGGKWASINLRGLNASQVDVLLSGVISRLTEKQIDGILIDDLDCPFEPNIIDNLLYLKAISDRTDLLLIFTSPRPPFPDFLFSASLPVSISQKIEEFSEDDILEILTGLGVHNAIWAKYIYLVSGSGHPQLAIAAIQSMQNNGWDTSELRTLNSLSGSNINIELVRTRTRERLLNELPEGGRRLLERLSLKIGSFRRNFVLDMAKVEPTVPDGGIVFDRLLGSWVDQHEGDRFSLSPLLSGLANKTLSNEERQKICFEIANSLIKGRSIDPIEANSTLFAAISGKNSQVIVRLCLAVLGANQKGLKIIAPHLPAFTLIRTDIFAYEDDAAVNQMFRGAQLLLICHEESRKEEFQKVLDRFETESALVEDEVKRDLMTFMVYEKLLNSEPTFGALPNFFDLVRKVDVFLESNDKNLPQDRLKEISTFQEIDGVPLVGFLFLNQARQIKHITELFPAFEFLNACEQKLRQKILRPFLNPDFDVDMMVAGAWLNEHKANSIDPPRHSEVFARLEELAKSWGEIGLAVSCRKYRAITIDEYGGDKDLAIAVLDEGMVLYGETNSELVRAKAKVLYRAEDHLASLELSKALIDGDAPLSITEKAFLGREAAVSAEKQGDYKTARSYYLYGSDAAAKCSISDMEPMRVGLLADAALASWHAGDRETCLRDFVIVLDEIKDIDPESSLRAAHCHAICRHVLLWLDQDAAGEKRLLADGEETKIYPGVISNPEPHPEIGKRPLTPIEMAWYMLASVENNSCLDVGITQKLATFLPKGPVIEGQIYLTLSKMRKSFTLFDSALFLTALSETVAELVYTKEKGDFKNSLDIKKITYGLLPIPTLKQQAGISILTEQFILSFASNCIFAERVAELDLLLNALEEGQGFKVRKEFLYSLHGTDAVTDYNTSVAALLAVHRRAIDRNLTLSPMQIFKLVFDAVQLANTTNNINEMARIAFDWLCSKWTFIRENQRFLLTCPAFYEESIEQALFAKGDLWKNKLINLLEAILPTMGIRNEPELRTLLTKMRK